MTWITPVVLYGHLDTPRGPVPGTTPTRAWDASWPELVDMLTYWLTTGHKALAGAWSPVRLDTPHRAARHVTHVGCLVLDVDDGTPIDRATEDWRPWRHLVHTSYSHTIETPRYRVVVPLAHTITPTEYRDVWRWAADRAPYVDRSAKDASRAYYLPGVASDDAPRAVRVHDDAPMLDPAGCRPPPPPQRRRTPRAGTQWSDAAREAAVLLRSDPSARRVWAERRGGRLVQRPVGEVCTDVLCPSCGDASVWWLIDPDRMTYAQCHHRQTCGWTGPLTELT